MKGFGDVNSNSIHHEGILVGSHDETNSTIKPAVLVCITLYYECSPKILS